MNIVKEFKVYLPESKMIQLDDDTPIFHTEAHASNEEIDFDSGLINILQKLSKKDKKNKITQKRKPSKNPIERKKTHKRIVTNCTSKTAVFKWSVEEKKYVTMIEVSGKLEIVYRTIDPMQYRMQLEGYNGLGSILRKCKIKKIKVFPITQKPFIYVKGSQPIKKYNKK